ncbi:glutamine synthetase family protein [Pleurotus pulmonarius]
MIDIERNPGIIGVKYTPSSMEVDRQELDIHNLPGIKYIRIQWVDLTNAICYRVIPISYFIKILQSPRPSISITKSILGLVHLTLVEGFSPIGEYLYVPDITTLKLCGYAPGHATVMGYFEEKTPKQDIPKSLEYKVDLCPRTILNRIVEDARVSLGLDFLVGFETEFILLSSVSPVQAVNEVSYGRASGLRTGSPEYIALEEMLDALQLSGIEVQALHKEGAPGQYEVVTAPLRPLQAIDALIHTRETIYNIANKHSLYATLAPRVYGNSCGSSSHAHISVHAAGESPVSSASPNLTNVEASFLASVLDHLPALIALTLPIPESFKRMVDGAWSGGTYVCWGTDNREAPLRLSNATSPSTRNFEYRALDGTANPYIAIAGIIGAGVEGVRGQVELKIRDNAGSVPAANMNDQERGALGVTKRLPLSWSEARENLEKNDLMGELLGRNFVAKYLDTLAKSFDTPSETERSARLLAYY